MREQNRSLIPTALVCFLLLLVLKALQAANQALNAQMAAQRAESQTVERKNAELSAIIEHQQDRAEALKVDNEQLRAQLDAINAESE